LCQNGSLSVLSSIGETEKSQGQVRRVRWVEDDSHVFGQKFPGKKGSVRRCVVMMQQPALLSPSSGRSLRTFWCSHCKTLTVWPARINSLNNPIDVKENDEHALYFALHLSRLFRSRWVCTFQLGGLLLCLRAITVSPALVTSDNPGQGCIIGGDLMKLLADVNTLLLLISCQNPGRNRVRPDTWLQIKGCKNQHVHPAAWNFVHWLPRYAGIIIYCCIMLLQLLYRWQYQSLKLWIPPRRWVWIGRIYWTHSAWLHFTIHYYTH
jgi:hypothetical protein